MSARSLSRLVVLAFLLLGTLTVSTRYRARQQTQLALADSLWRLTYDVCFEADPQVGEQEDSARLQIGRPYPMPNLEIVDQDITNPYPNLHVEEWESRASGNREFRLSTRHAGPYNVTTEFNLRLQAGDAGMARPPLESLSQVRRDRYTARSNDFPTQSSSIGKVLQNMPDDAVTASQKLQWLFDYSLKELKRASAEDEGDDVLWALAEMRTSDLGRAKVFVTLCRAIDIPARLVVGFELRHGQQAQPHVWTEVHRDNRWIPFDPVYGSTRVMPSLFVPIRRAGASIVRGEDVENIVANYSIQRMPPDPDVLKSEAKHPAHVFDLTRLPLPLHDTLSLMLLLPLGALITAVFRNLVGLQTLGTFAPALLAMSIIYAAWGTGLVMLTVVIIAGLLGRSLLEKLHLLMVPRLSIVLTVIILCVVFAVSLLNYWSPGQTAQTVLIPLVILTILIERFYVTSEEDSPGFAVQLVLGTIVVAAFCYLLLRWEYIGQLVLIYPEIHLFTIAAFVLIGRYSGYRLTELWRFRDLVNNNKDSQPPADAT
ncbi:MAG: 7TM domain-containing protein [Bythopirellula sp.]